LTHTLKFGCLAPDGRGVARLVHAVYDFSRIDNIALGLHDGRMKRLSITELIFIERCPSWRVRAALCLWAIGLRRQAQRLIE
jgi:hypothetical protein